MAASCSSYSSALELCALAQPPLDDLAHRPRFPLQDPVLELTLSDGPSKFALVLYHYLVKDLVDLPGWRTKQVPPLVLVAGEVLVVNGVV